MSQTPDLPQSSYDPELPTTRAQELLSRLQRRAARRRTLWNGHVAGFISINAFLVFLDIVTRGGVWSPFVIGAMAIPLVSHWIHKRRRDRLQETLADEIQRNPSLPDRVFRPLRKYHRATTHFLMGLGTGATISAYMFLIDFMTRGQPFAAIVTASIALPVIFHALFTRGRRAALRAQLEAGGDDKPESLPRRRDRLPRHTLATVEPAPAEAPGVHPMLTEARRVEREITSRIAASEAAPDELLAGVQELLQEIESLCTLSVEFSRAVSAMPLSELQKDRATLQRKLQNNPSGSLASQYSDSLAQVESQLLSVEELENRRELLELRIRTGVNSMREINVNLLRMQGDAALGEINRMVRIRTDELSGYLSDLQKTYQELNEEFGGSS